MQIAFVGRNFKIDIGLSSYATKANFKRVTEVDTYNLEAKSDLASLKVEVDKTDVEKLKTVLVDFKISNVVKNEVFKKSVSDKLVAKLDAFDPSKLFLKSKYDTENLNLGK